MVDLTESSTWEDGIYQLETDDPVQGGPVTEDTGGGGANHGAGLSNLQAQQLANRTNYLKARAASSVDAIVKSSMFS